jgi:hypothetical protein
LIGPTLEKKVRENADMMLAALKRQAEAARPASVASTGRP